MSVKSISILTILLLIVSSCTTQIPIEKYLNTNSSLILTHKKINGETGLTENEEIMIEPHSEKFIKFIKWCNENSSDWKSASDSYVAKLVVSQKDFQLLCLHRSVVVDLIENGKSKRYIKPIDIGELDFLIN